MKKFRFVLIFILIGLCLSACTWPKVFVRSSSGWVTYDRLNHRLEIVWESTTATPVDSVAVGTSIPEGEVIEK